jgi:hypothetical protein
MAQTGTRVLSTHVLMAERIVDHRAVQAWADRLDHYG